MAAEASTTIRKYDKDSHWTGRQQRKPQAELIPLGDGWAIVVLSAKVSVLELAG